MEHELRTLGFATIKELETARGILASGKEELYGCIFGRDSLITSLKLLSAYERTKDEYLLTLVQKILRNLAHLQGIEYNIESGEEPGKIIHEYREDNHAHLTERAERPWFVYPDRTMKNYDSVDATPLFLIAVARYWSASSDDAFKEEIAPATRAALTWLTEMMAQDPRGFLTYEFPAERIHGGLTTQSWMDSGESVFHEDGSPTPYPIAPLEAQAYAYQALRLWAHEREAAELKDRFNAHFVRKEPFSVAFALDGTGAPMTSPRSSIGHLFWVSYGTETILADDYIPRAVELLMSPELFEPRAGLRTLSKRSSRFDPKSYHNGSIWPHDTAIAAEGLSMLGYHEESARLRAALLAAWGHFRTPIELFVYTDEGFSEYASPTGQRACLKQAWSAASMLADL